MEEIKQDLNKILERKGIAYGNVGEKLLSLMEIYIQTQFSDLQKKNFRNAFELMGKLDHLLDTSEENKESIEDFLSGKKHLPYSNIFEILNELKENLDSHSYKKFIVFACAAVNYSGFDSIKERHLEGISVGLSVMNVLAIKDENLKLNVRNFLTKGGSGGNFADDFVDAKKDNRSLVDAIVRLRIAIKQLSKITHGKFNFLFFAAKLFKIYINPKIKQKIWKRN